MGVSTHSRPRAAGSTLSIPSNLGNVSTHSRPRAAGSAVKRRFRSLSSFQHTAARGRLAVGGFPSGLFVLVSTHSRPRAAGLFFCSHTFSNLVSTHSRPWAAGRLILKRKRPAMFQHTAARGRLAESLALFRRRFCFNTQPPEGGWKILWPACCFRGCFNTQPPEGGWKILWPACCFRGCFNTQPPEGGWISATLPNSAAGVSTHSRPRAAGGVIGIISPKILFQHTAARGRLGLFVTVVVTRVSFNTQPPEGGWQAAELRPLGKFCFNTQPPEGGWSAIFSASSFDMLFQHTAARGRLGL